ncbi:MAG TPA: PKD domain-containing protein, partial [Gemmatimonadales bacterium]
ERVLEPEVWSPGGMRVLTGASRAFPYYPRTFLAPNGKVFYAGEQRPSRYLDVTGRGDWESGFTSILYGNREYGAAVMYDAGKVLYVGGGRTTNTAEIIDLNSAAPAWQWTGSMAFPRRHLNATLLPTGEVLATSGTSGPGFNDIATVVHAAEVWSPVTETWTTLASNSVDRGYHSTSILLPDGRVLHAGSGQGGGQDGILNAELFSPPYLFLGPRPEITAAPSRVGYGTTFHLRTSDADIARVSLIRLGSTTHAFDMNQRFQWLSFERATGGLQIIAPTSRHVTPPGHYMLFILNEAGVPSVAKIVQIGSSGDPPPPPDAAPTAGFTVTCAGFDCEFTDSSTDDGEVTAWSWDFDDNSGTSVERNPRYAYTAEGSYDVTLTVTDDNGATATITRTITVALPPPNSSPTAGFAASCAGLTCTFTDQSSDSDGRVTAWGWTFGDGAEAATPNPSHTYAAEGSYEVTLVATDDDDATGTATQPVTVTPPPPNSSPTAGFTASCTGLTCTFTDQSSDGDGSVTGWSWVFGDGASATTQNPSHSYATEGPYEVSLVATDDDDASGTATQTVTVTPLPPNAPPTAGFSSSCTGLTCTFTDQSSDGDGSVTAWSWSFGDGASATTRNPSRTYAANGTYSVTLVASDDDNATGSATQTVTVTAPVTRAINLTVTGRSDATKQYMTLQWSGAIGATLDVFRNGTRITNTANDGHYTNSRTYQGDITYTYRVCEPGTSVCSNYATVVFGSGGTPNQPPVANFSPSCNGTTCSFADLSTDSDGSITAWSWAFGDGITSTVRSPSYTYAAEGSFEVSLLATDDDGATATTTKTLVVAAPEPNSPPTAGFAATCAGRTCTFTDQSSDGDGSVTGWSWTFGDGATATTRNPSRTYAANGSYTVTLVATDNDGATGTEVKAVTVSGPTIVLSVTSRSDATTQYMVLTWSGASGAMVDVYRNGALLKTTENDGKYTNTRTYSGAASYTYKVCQAGTTVCSNEAAVVF